MFHCTPRLQVLRLSGNATHRPDLRTGETQNEHLVLNCSSKAWFQELNTAHEASGIAGPVQNQVRRSMPGPGESGGLQRGGPWLGWAEGLHQPQESSSASKKGYEGASSSEGRKLTVTPPSGTRMHMHTHAGAHAVTVSRPLADLCGSGGAEVEALVWQGKEEAEDG